MKQPFWTSLVAIAENEDSSARFRLAINALTWKRHMSLSLSTHSSEIATGPHPTTIESGCTMPPVAEMGKNSGIEHL